MLLYRSALATKRPLHARVFGERCDKRHLSALASCMAHGRLLETTPSELNLDCTLPTGQSFRWRRIRSGEYIGAIENRLVHLEQLPKDVRYTVLARGPGAEEEDDHACLRDYFNLDICLTDLYKYWGSRCPRFKALAEHIQGARLLRQDPVECLFQFICSSNNHISRIHGMVERLCARYGTPLGTAGKIRVGSCEVGDLSFHAFPTLEQLKEVREEDLRSDGFGYRAKFITGTVESLMSKVDGGRSWLMHLRELPYEQVVEELCQLPGIGPKVAACVSLFSLDKHQAIPVDTHVWQLAVRHYTPHLGGKSLTKKVHEEVARALVDTFGPRAGWAHNVLFIAELSSHQELLPDHLRSSQKAKKGSKKVEADVNLTEGAGLLQAMVKVEEIDVVGPETPSEDHHHRGRRSRKQLSPVKMKEDFTNDDDPTWVPEGRGSKRFRGPQP